MFETSSRLKVYHARFPGSVRWRFTRDGIEVERRGIPRTEGSPNTASRVWRDFGGEINEFAAKYAVPAELIAATICTESLGDRNAARQEPGYVSDEQTPHKVSIGLMQTLISTARDTLKRRGINPGTITRSWLLNPANSVQAGTSYIKQQGSVTGYDPVVVAAAYNAGGVYREKGELNGFKLRQYPIGTSRHCDRWIQFFNDFVAVVQAEDIHLTCSFRQGTAIGRRLMFPLRLGLDANTPADIAFETFFRNNEAEKKFGYFPIGYNLQWHGGIHLFAPAGEAVYNIYEGSIVAAKLACDDADGGIGTTEGRACATGPSNGFVLVRHILEDNEGRGFFSLHMHLADEAFSSADIPWLARLRRSACEDTPDVVRRLMSGGFVTLARHEKLAPLLVVKAGEQIGRCGRVACKSTDGEVFGEHFEVFSGDDLVASSTVAELAGLKDYLDGGKPTLTLNRHYGSFPDRNGLADRSPDAFDRSRRAEEGCPLEVFGVDNDAGNRFALVPVGADKRWVVYEWPSDNGLQVDGEISNDTETQWYGVRDESSEVVYDSSAMHGIAELLLAADPELIIPDNIAKRVEIAAFYHANENAKLLRHTYLDSLSEWSLDPHRVFDNERTSYLSDEEAAAHRKQLRRFQLWKHLPGVTQLRGFARAVDGDHVRHYRYHPVTFLRWLGEQLGTAVAVPTGIPELLEDTSAANDRWFVFREVTRVSETMPAGAISRQRWDVEPAKERFFYLFGVHCDGTSDVWEVRTDVDGRFRTGLREQRCPRNGSGQDGEYEDAVAVAGKDALGEPIRYFVMLSEVGLPDNRLFDSVDGIVSDPSRRCADVDDETQSPKWSCSDGTEIVGVMNYLREGRRRRRRYEDLVTQWELFRRPSGLIDEPRARRRRILADLGRLLCGILEARPACRKHLSVSGAKHLHALGSRASKDRIQLCGECGSAADYVCRLVSSQGFRETCLDHLSTMRKVGDQPEEFSLFEDTVGEVIRDITRFPCGVELLCELLPECSSPEQHTWLQRLLLLDNDIVWPDGDRTPAPDTNGGSPVSDVIGGTRVLSSGLVDILQEVSRFGITSWRRGRMHRTLENVIMTVEPSLRLKSGLCSVRSIEGVPSALEGRVSGNHGAHWRIEFDGPDNAAHGRLLARCVDSTTVARLSAALDAVGILYCLAELSDTDAENRTHGLDTVNALVDAVSLALECFPKAGARPLLLLGAVSAGIDALIAGRSAAREFEEHDIDAAVWNLIAVGGHCLVAGNSVISSYAFIAAACGLSATGVGLLPGLIVAFVGLVAALGAEAVADMADNDAVEEFLLRTPWGIHPERDLEHATTEYLERCYGEIVRVLNRHRVTVGEDMLRVTLWLRTLARETRIVLQEIRMASANTGQYDERTVVRDVELTGWSPGQLRDPRTGLFPVRVDLRELMDQDQRRFWEANPPDWISVCSRVDLHGDGVVILPEQGKVLQTSAYGPDNVSERVV